MSFTIYTHKFYYNFNNNNNEKREGGHQNFVDKSRRSATNTSLSTFVHTHIHVKHAQNNIKLLNKTILCPKNF